MLFVLYLLGTEISSVDEAWLVKRTELTLYYVLNELFTNYTLRCNLKDQRNITQYNTQARESVGHPI